MLVKFLFKFPFEPILKFFVGFADLVGSTVDGVGCWGDLDLGGDGPRGWVRRGVLLGGVVEGEGQGLGGARAGREGLRVERGLVGREGGADVGLVSGVKTG